MSVKEMLVELIHRAITDWKEGDVSEHIADHLIENCATVQEWISIKERLPKTNDKVLVCYSNSNIAVAKYIRVDGLEFWFEEFAYYQNITHWMPLPEPPKGENEE